MIDNRLNYDRIFPVESSSNEEWLTPDLLRLAGIELSSPDDGYETNSSSLLSNSSSDSRFFPISTNRHHDCSAAIMHQVSDLYSRRIAERVNSFI